MATTSPKLLEISHEEYLYMSPEGLERLSTLLDPAKPNKNILWTNDYTVELPIRVKREGPGSEAPFTLISAMIYAMKNYPDHLAMWVKRDKQEFTWTYKQYYDDSCLFAKGLISLGVTKCKAVNIIGFNAPEWCISFFGSIFANNLPVGVYTTNGAEAC